MGHGVSTRTVPSGGNRTRLRFGLGLLLLEHLQENLDDIRVVPFPEILPQDFHGLVQRQGGALGHGGEHGDKVLHHRHNAGGKRDLPTTQPGRKTFPVETFVVIEDYVAIAAGARIFSISDWPGEGKRVCGPMVPDEHRNLNRGPVTIKKDVFIGLNAVVMPGVTVGEGAVIGANAVVSRDIEPWKIAVGAPAKPIAERDPVTVPDLP